MEGAFAFDGTWIQVEVLHDSTGAHRRDDRSGARSDLKRSGKHTDGSPGAAPGGCISQA
jgi:hypothetical protein